jgi:hypothetical protein
MWVGTPHGGNRKRTVCGYLRGSFVIDLLYTNPNPNPNREDEEEQYEGREWHLGSVLQMKK